MKLNKSSGFIFFTDPFNIMEVNKVWKVYIPHHVFYSPKGYLHGHCDMNSLTVFICGLTYSNEQNKESLIGTWDLASRESMSYHLLERNACWIQTFNSRCRTLGCNLFVKSQKVSCNCIIYDPDDLSKTYFSRGWQSDEPGMNPYIQINDGMNELVSVFLSTNHDWNKLSHDKRGGVNFIKPFSTSHTFSLDKLLLRVLYIFQVVGMVTDNRFIQQSSYVRTVVDTPAVTHQLTNRTQQISKAISSKWSIPVAKLWFMNVFMKQLLDTLFGLLLMYILMEAEVTNNIASFILFWAEHVAEQMNLLLNWLMGAPAGLKLNRQLTEFLGHFFLYHIYLWRGYLSLLQPVLGTVLWYASFVGVFGITFQLCLLQDILSMMTLHIYCFYVYAARLYRLQVFMLSSLWRLFRGKKWNVLRYRVDSASFDVDQLFIGTLLFTILFFLLPTTALYYVVFTVLRLVVLTVQGSISRMVHFINELPAYSIVLWLIRSKSIAGDVVFNVITESTTDHCCMFTMQIRPLPLGKLLRRSKAPLNVNQSQTRDSWGYFIQNLMKGHLIYPWIETDR